MDSKTTTLLLRSQAHGYVAGTSVVSYAKVSSERQVTHSAATLTCHLYEQIATFSDEVDLIWRRKAGWNIPKVLFVIQKTVPQKKCLIINVAQSYFGTFIILSKGTNFSIFYVYFDVLIQLFIHFPPADRGGKSELFFDAETYIAVIPFVSMHGIMIIYDVSANNVPDPIPGIHICITSPGYNYLYAETIPIIALELTLLCLTISRGFHFYQAQRRISWSFRGRRSLASILFRDSIMIPFVTLVILFACLVLLLRAPFGPIFQIVYLICVFWPGIAGPRLILNLRQAYYAPFKDECHRADLDTEDSDCL
ncbi:hypothetical protein JR316_0012981 [Psilocybe cubensis]|uniref:Uncharacterized protein n=1 Tax=Psilocybe cubensis TaxID=181762 RepID=A0ACB8GFP2_PSICU|nr:hypothetical protein JR316_0012981 [Psilocybe cubensis]KAH9474520.1 hypothetical protein JR316_0012981 [Psilocybe cubensis]